MDGEKHIGSAIEGELVNFKEIEIVGGGIVHARHKHLIAALAQNIFHCHSAFEVAVGFVVFHTRLHALVEKRAGTIVAIVTAMTGI